MAEASMLETPSLRLTWSEAAWDSAIFHYPVLQITTLEASGASAAADFAAFEAQRDALGAGLVSCRLSHDRLRESMLLEERGFRFIEMVFQPEMDLPGGITEPEDALQVALATEQDLPQVLEIAGSAFQNERFHVDPRLDSSLGDLRYCNWVRSSLTHPTQKLQVLRDAGEIVAFFVTELQADGTLYWHLNAVSPNAQGKGYGRRAWQTMMTQAARQGGKCIRTCIVARNHRVLNLYARLGFRFPPPLMTFHWFRCNQNA